jgi:hypothetical protein
MGRSRKPLSAQAFRGFESPSLRHEMTLTVNDDWQDETISLKVPGQFTDLCLGVLASLLAERLEAINRHQLGCQIAVKRRSVSKYDLEKFHGNGFWLHVSIHSPGVCGRRHSDKVGRAIRRLVI